MRLVMIDNYDSFTFNLVQLFYEFDLEVLVYRNDRITLDRIEKAAPDWICISPGPRDPAHAGISGAVVQRFGPTVPILGVCLGMQVINEVFGGRTIRAPFPVHGKRCCVYHHGEGILAGIPSPFRVARYHSLQIELSSSFIMPTAVAEDRVCMAVQHRSWPLCGVQFHPESFLSEYGLELVESFLALHPAWINQRGECRNRKDRFPRARTVVSHPVEYSRAAEAPR